MSRRPRRNHTAAFKAKVALAAVKGDRTLEQLAEQFDVHTNQITSAKAQLESGAAEGPLAAWDAKIPDSKPSRLVHDIAQRTSPGESTAVVHDDLKTPVVEIGPMPGHMWRQQDVRQRPQAMVTR